MGLQNPKNPLVIGLFEYKQLDKTVTVLYYCTSNPNSNLAVADETAEINIIITSLPKVIWEQGRVAAAVPGAGWHKGFRIRNVCIVFLKDRCANVQYFSVRKQE